MIEGGEKKEDSEWIDEDEAPDLSTPEWQRKFHSAPVRRGWPLIDTPDDPTLVQIDADIIERFRQGGAGWQSRINAALREWLDTH